MRGHYAGGARCATGDPCVQDDLKVLLPPSSRRIVHRRLEIRGGGEKLAGSLRSVLSDTGGVPFALPNNSVVFQ